MLFGMHTASAPDMGQLQSSSHCDVAFSGPATETAVTFTSPAGRALPMATVMPLHSSHTFAPVPSLQATGQWSDQQTPVTAEPIVNSQRLSSPPAAYIPVTVHWFYCRSIELRQIWQPFSLMDSANLELAFQYIISGKSCSSHDIFSVNPCVTRWLLFQCLLS